MDTFRPLPDVTVLSEQEIPGVGWLHGTDALLDDLRLAPGTEPFTGPDQRALEDVLAGFAPG